MEGKGTKEKTFICQTYKQTVKREQIKIGKGTFRGIIGMKYNVELVKKFLEDDPDIHRAILAYISDYSLVATSLVPHGLEFDSDSLQLASIDHSMWFHRPFRIDEWLLYACEPVSTSNARGLSRGSFYDQNGNMIASTMQEGLIRQIKKGD